MKKLMCIGILLIILTASIVGCDSKGETNAIKNKVDQASANKETDQGKSVSIQESRIIKGVSISPKSFTDQDFLDFLSKAQNNGDVLRWGGNYTEFSKQEKNSAKSTITIAKDYDLIPVIETDFFTMEDVSLPLTPEQINNYIDAAVNFAKENEPPYLGLGVEVNYKFNEAPQFIDEYAKVFDLAYDEIKEVSPETKVFITFQLEWMKGLKGGLYGRTDDTDHPEWDLIDKFPKADLIGFTTYPCLAFKSPGEIPMDYYTEIRDYTSKPIVFTEIGWFSNNSIIGWESSEEEQANFVRAFFSRTEELKPEMNIWIFMYDQPIQEPFESMGLISSDGAERKAWNVWANLENYNDNVTENVVSSPIVFMSRADSSEGELYLMDTDGTINRLTNNNRHENNPAFSPDRKKVAFHAGEEGDLLTWEIYVLDLETGEEQKITSNKVIDGHPDWSPDGTKLVFSSFVDKQGNPSGTADIYTINIDGTDLTQLTDSVHEDNDAEWSPDGKYIVYKSTDNTKINGREEIYVMNADGSSKRRLTTTEGWQSDHDPSWSMDSKTITFERFVGSRPWFDMGNADVLSENLDELTPWDIYTVDLDGNVQQLTNAEKGDISFLPVYSLDNEHILCIKIEFIEQNNSVIGAYHRYYIMKKDGGNNHQMIPDDSHTYTLEYFDW